MKLSIVLSTHAAKFQAVAYKGDFEQNVAKIASYGFDGVEPALRDPGLVDHVLSPLTGGEKAVMSDMIGLAADAVLMCVGSGVDEAMNRYNSFRHEAVN